MKAIMELLQRVKAYIAPKDFYRLELPTVAPSTGHGWCDGGLCPFHADQHAGSFRVNFSTGAFCCFSCDAKGSDIIAFTQLCYGLNFNDAVRKLADEWGV